jgi:hypothetical protein
VARVEGQDDQISGRSELGGQNREHVPPF